METGWDNSATKYPDSTMGFEFMDSLSSFGSKIGDNLMSTTEKALQASVTKATTDLNSKLEAELNRALNLPSGSATATPSVVPVTYNVTQPSNNNDQMMQMMMMMQNQAKGLGINPKVLMYSGIGVGVLLVGLISYKVISSSGGKA